MASLCGMMVNTSRAKPAEHKKLTDMALRVLIFVDLEKAGHSSRIFHSHSFFIGYYREYLKILKTKYSERRTDSLSENFFDGRECERICRVVCSFN